MESFQLTLPPVLALLSSISGTSLSFVNILVLIIVITIVTIVIVTIVIVIIAIVLKATAAAAVGKMELARTHGTEIPEGWALDKWAFFHSLCIVSSSPSPSS